LSRYKAAPKSQRARRRYLTPYEYRAVRHLVIECGETMADVARTLGLSYWTVRDIVTKRRKPRKTGQTRYACKSRDGEFVRHLYKLHIDSDGNYRVCLRCRKVSFRLAAGESDRCHFRGF
jgi:hypothetical protein